MLMVPIAINQVDLETQVRWTTPVSEYYVIAEMQRRSYDLPEQLGRRGTALSLDQISDHSAACLRLAKLAKLEADWDTYGADPIASGCIAKTQVLLDALPSSIPSPEITPNPNGTLTLDWETEDQTLSLEIGSTRFSSFWESRQGVKTDEGVLEQAIPRFATKALASLFPDSAPSLRLSERLMTDAHGKYGSITVTCSG